MPPLRPRTAVVFAFLAAAATISAAESADSFHVTEDGTLESPSSTWLVFNNAYDGLFSDAKMSGVELLQREVRIATNGDVRLQPTPGQWDAAPQIVERKVDREHQRVDAILSYPDFGFKYTVRMELAAGAVKLSVLLDQPLPAKLQGRAGLNLEFLPSAYFRKSFAIDGRYHPLPLHPSSDMNRAGTGQIEPAPLASGRRLTLAPEDPQNRVTIEAQEGELSLYDGRDQAQNGWFVVRTLLPADKTGAVATWTLSASLDPAWTRPPVITHSQVGYHPGGRKVALIELDKRDTREITAKLIQIDETGEKRVVHTASPVEKGPYLRYHYKAFDFSHVVQPGLYCIAYGDVESDCFRISPDVYATAWQPTLDVYLPVAMDHIAVKEGYRVWHGNAHFDDARQAPVNHVHFDLYAQGPTTDSPFAPGQHVPGLNVGGWLDAGDFDLRTQTQYHLVQSLVQLWEDFRVTRDETRVDYDARKVTLHTPDGIPDVLQQIEHGTLALITQHRVFGRAIHGIVEPDLDQYTHLGDAASKTDGRVYDETIDPKVFTEIKSGRPDDRWVFTSKTTPLNYGSAAALAAASRVLRERNPALAEECLKTARYVWDEEHSHAPDLFHSGNTTGGELNEEEFDAATQLLLATHEPLYAERIKSLWPEVKKDFVGNAMQALRVAPLMDEAFRGMLRADAEAFAKAAPSPFQDNPFEVPITTGGWAGSGAVIRYSTVHYALHRAYPDLFDAKPVFDGLDFIYGRHPGSSLSLVSAVGTRSKEVAYGSNRADFSFIAGGIVPGILILKPGFPENKEDWPFLWGENEYVVNLGGSYLYLVHAAQSLLNEKR